MNCVSEISKAVKFLRKSRNLTQEKFAEAVNISVNGLRNIEQGRYAPNPKTIDSICNTFDITLISLLSLAHPTEKYLSEKIFSLSKEKREKISKIIDLNLY